MERRYTLIKMFHEDDETEEIAFVVKASFEPTTQFVVNLTHDAINPRHQDRDYIFSDVEAVKEFITTTFGIEFLEFRYYSFDRERVQLSLEDHGDA